MEKAGAIDLLYKAHRLLSEMEVRPRDYGTGEPLFTSEIHTIAAVGAAPGCNLTSLAAALGVSKAAASKFVKKLIAAGYLVKSRSRDDDRGVEFNLTRKGGAAARGHERFARSTFDPLRREEAALSTRDHALIRSFLERLIGCMGK